MIVDNIELRELIIKPTLELLGKYNKATENILVAMVQSHANDSHRKGMGIYDIDASTHRLVWDQYLAYNPELASKIRGLASQREFLVHPDTELATNLCYATAIAWVVYVVHPKLIPPSKLAQFKKQKSVNTH